MSAPRVGFGPADAERQAGNAAAKYLSRALAMLAERLGLEKLLANDPAGFAVQFAPLLAALIETQAREYQSWVFYERLGEIGEPLASAFHESSPWSARFEDKARGGDL